MLGEKIGEERGKVTGRRALKSEDPRYLKLEISFDQSIYIRAAVSALEHEAVQGGLLAIAVLFAFFRRLRMTLLVAAALPLSLTIAVTCLYLAGDSLNLATMMGLTLAVGMLVDNAIVVVEAILRRREAGEAVRSAAMEGTAEVGLAVVTSTLTTMVVVLPFIFLSEDSDARLWLASIGLPIAYALLASLAVALILVPLGSVYLRRRGETPLAPPSPSPDPTPSPVAEAAPEEPVQFERVGYFVADWKDHRPNHPVFNRSVGLRDTWARLEKAGG